jgi:hypothetical protein
LAPLTFVVWSTAFCLRACISSRSQRRRLRSVSSRSAGLVQDAGAGEQGSVSCLASSGSFRHSTTDNRPLTTDNQLYALCPSRLQPIQPINPSQYLPGEAKPLESFHLAPSALSLPPFHNGRLPMDAGSGKNVLSLRPFKSFQRPEVQ